MLATVDPPSPPTPNGSNKPTTCRPNAFDNRPPSYCIANDDVYIHVQLLSQGLGLTVISCIDEVKSQVDLTCSQRFIGLSN